LEGIGKSGVKEIYFFGCYTSANDAGLRALQHIADITHATVYATPYKVNYMSDRQMYNPKPKTAPGELWMMSFTPNEKK
jgi:hypothetical protein